MKLSAVFAGVALLAALAGTSLWLGSRQERLPEPTIATIAPAALYASTFRDLDGHPRSLGEFQGRVLVLNFWATWCAPCRAEMPAFARIRAKWLSNGVEIVGISSEDAGIVRKFAADLGIGYPLLVGGTEVEELSRRLGNRLAVLPHSAILGPAGEVLDTRVGPFSEQELEERLRAFAGKSR